MMSFSSDLTATYGLDLLTGSQAVAARAEQLLNFLFEEWQLGPTLGTDYYRRESSDLKRELDRQLRSLEDVTSVTSTIEETSSRQWLYRAEVSSIFGTASVEATI